MGNDTKFRLARSRIALVRSLRAHARASMTKNSHARVRGRVKTARAEARESGQISSVRDG